VPGYRAPEATISPASRVPLALVGLLRDAKPRQAGDPDISGVLAGQAAAVAALIGSAAGDTAGDTVRPEVLVRGALAWTQLFGLISFELFGQYVGSFEPAEELFDYAVAQLAQIVGL
jgi:hypothetical protein